MGLTFFPCSSYATANSSGLGGFFRYSCDPAQQAKAFEQAQAFARAPQGTVAFTGSYGTGKTHLLVAIANARREANQPCLYVSAVTLFEAISDRIHHEREYQPLLQRAARTPLLLLDDLDKPKPSEFRESVYTSYSTNAAGLVSRWR